MATECDPPSYPKHGTFGDLLKWHLAWGTRPNCFMHENGVNARWTLALFADLVCGDNVQRKSAQRNIANWQNGRLPDQRQDAERIANIFEELFGSDPRLIRWKNDLANALERGRAEQAARIARQSIPQRRPPDSSAYSVSEKTCSGVESSAFVGLKVVRNYPMGSSFHNLLKFHISTGTRPDRIFHKWSAFELAEIAFDERDEMFARERSLYNWQTGKYLPYEIEFQRISLAFFGNQTEYNHWRSDFHRAFYEASAQKMQL